jgi:hypothetical protein
MGNREVKTLHGWWKVKSLKKEECPMGGKDTLHWIIYIEV